MRSSLIVVPVIALMGLIACEGSRGSVGQRSGKGMPDQLKEKGAPGEEGAQDLVATGAILDGAYNVHWNREGGVDGVLSLDSVRGLYHWSGEAPTVDQRSFHFVDAPKGRYTVQMKPDAIGKTLAELPDRATVAVVNFAPDRVGFESMDAEALVEVRVDQKRHELFMHSVVSEFEGWKIVYLWTP